MKESLYNALANLKNRKLNRQDILLIMVGLVVVVFIGNKIYQSINTGMRTKMASIEIRKSDFTQIRTLVEKYKTLNNKKNLIEEQLRKSQLNFEQVATTLDKIVNDSLGNNNYDLRKIRQPTEVGLDFKKQDFSLTINAINLDQLVKILYQIESGNNPIFLGKIDVAKSDPNQGTLKAVIEIFSIVNAKNKQPSA